MPLDLNAVPPRWIEDMRERFHREYEQVKVDVVLGSLLQREEDYFLFDRGFPFVQYEGNRIFPGICFPKVITHPRTFMDFQMNIDQRFIEPGFNHDGKQTIMGMEIQVNAAVPEGSFLMYNRNGVAEALLKWRDVKSWKLPRVTESWLERWRR